jgi:hypothetical protein
MGPIFSASKGNDEAEARIWLIEVRRGLRCHEREKVCLFLIKIIVYLIAKKKEYVFFFFFF